MTLSTHAVIGAAFAQFFPQNPLAAFAVGFVSHFAADAIPHWDYQLKSRTVDSKNYLNNDMRIGRRALPDLAKIAFDFCLGLALAVTIFPASSTLEYWSVLAGAMGGIVPDPLQFACWKIRREPLTSLQKLHHLAHTNYRIKNKPVLGIMLQVVVVVVCIFLLQSITQVG